ncbi:hypothetical protein PHJA_001433800 [Phtheirospermum japonicum]|uniref:Uncharacterized protein n=1 Tax=Phtheirospermum japonicum TaxID=374723 RepID=A0A830CCE5_9LAMI|nr:hypothetical protein PHJA_001433800 [Phtheirospermum japonicum]
MSNGEVRKVSVQDIQLVQNLIERCLQLYMSEKEVVSTFLIQAKIEPGFTELVWQKLEAENEDFFRAYHMRLVVKDQIMRFNQLLERQVGLMRQVCQTGVASIPMSNESRINSMHNPSAYRAPQPSRPLVKTENMHQAVGSNIPNVYSSGTSSLQPCMQVGVHMAGHADVSENLALVQNSNTRMAQGTSSGVMIKSEDGYADDDACFMFGADNNLLESRTEIGEASVSPFNCGDSGSQALNEAILDQEMNSIGFLGQIPRNFSLSDLTADFTNSNDILDNYSRSPFLGTDANVLDTNIKDEQEEIKRLDTISEGPSHEDFGGD